jgi:hypothetical protein
MDWSMLGWTELGGGGELSWMNWIELGLGNSDVGWIELDLPACVWF